MFTLTFSLVLLVQSSPAQSQDGGRCSCVPGGSCDAEPYGALALDISVLGLFPPCPAHGSIRCCSRQGLEALYEGMLRAAISQNDVGIIKVRPLVSVDALISEVKKIKKDPGMECGCIPRGICMQHLTRQTRDCSGQHELCCVPQHTHNDVVVNVFSHQEKVWQSTTTTPVPRSVKPQHVKPQPVFRPQSARNQPVKKSDNDGDNVGLLCLEATDCNKVYGYDALDIANFGVLSPCSKRGFHRCVEPKPYVHIEKKENNQNHLSTTQPVQSTTSTTTTTTTSTTTTTTTSSTSLSLGSVQFPDQNVRFVPCVQPNKCLGSVYDIGSGEHLTRYGVLPQCSDGMIRCIFQVDLGIFSHLDNINLPIFTMDEERIKQFFKEDTAEDATEEYNFSENENLMKDAKTETTNIVQDYSYLHTDEDSSVEFFNQHRIFNGRKSLTLTNNNNPFEPLLTASTQPTVKIEQSSESPLLSLKRFSQSTNSKPTSRSVISTTPQEYRYVATTTEKTADLRKFFGSPRRNNIIDAIRERGRNKPVKDDDQESDADKFKAQFAHFEKKASIDMDMNGNLVISGGRTVFHLPPGISPPGSDQVTSPEQENSSEKTSNQPNIPQTSEEVPIFFDPQEAPHVIDALKNSKNAVIQVLTDDNQQMVLNVKNDQLLSILQALHSALDNVQS